MSTPSFVPARMGALFLALACSLGSGVRLHAQSIVADAIIHSPDPAAGETFGNRIAIERDWMAVGADHDAGVLAPGRVHLYQRERGDWIHRQTLMAPDAMDGDHFGLPVVMKDDRLVVGMPLDDELGNRSGSALVYRLVGDTWVLEQKLLPHIPDNTGAMFGIEISFGESVDEILIGAFLESIDAHTAGGVWCFQHDGEAYRIVQRLTVHQPVAYFGRSIDCENGILAVGTPGAIGPSGDRHGGVAIHHRENGLWVMDGMLIPENPHAYQTFGETLDMEADRLAVGSPREDTYGHDAGAVHVYKMVDGLPRIETTIEPPSVPGIEAFGFPLAFDPDGARLIISAYATSTSEAIQCGASWLFERVDGDWTGGVRLVGPSPDDGDFFGLSVAFDDGGVVLGQPRDDTVGQDTGFIASFPLGDCDESGMLDVWEIAEGIADDADFDGVPDACDDLVGDLDGDGDIDGADFGIFIALWGTDGSAGGDFDGDGVVGGGDLAWLLAGWTG